MSELTVHLQAVGVNGPGLPDWPQTRTILAGSAPYQATATVLAAPQALPSAERRRVGAAIKLSMGVGFEAVHAAGIDPATLSAVFASSEGDCDNCHVLCETLASDDRQISPTRFHNSVHNAPSGYWSIATHCMAPASSICAYDGTFAAGLLEAASQIASTAAPCLLIAYDTVFPEPLHRLRPFPGAFGVALLLSATRSADTLASLTLSLSDTTPCTLQEGPLEALRSAIPAARALPLLTAIAQAQPSTVTLEYLPQLALSVALKP